MTAPIPDARAAFAPAILFVLPTMRAGGSERVISTLANYWAGTGRKVSVATFEPSSAAPYYPLDHRIAALPLNLPPTKSSAASAITRTGERILAVRRTIRTVRPDVVISFLTKANVLTVLAAQGLGVPVIISERNNPRIQRFSRLWDVARAYAFPRADAMVSMTQGALDFYPPRQRPNARIIRNPVSLPADLRIRRNGRTLTAVGRLNKQKRFDRLLDAYALIAADFPDWRLVIWGEGGERAALEAQIDRLGLASRVEMPGLTREPGRWVETADILALTSDYEGWANVIVEAMAAGIAVVSVDCDYGPKELLGYERPAGEARTERAGIIVAKDDVRALADALASLMRDTARREGLGRNGAAYASRFTVPAIAAEWDDLIAEVVGRKTA